MTKRLSVTARDYLFGQWTYQFSVSKRIKNPTLNYQFEGTKLILVYNGSAAHTRGSHIQVVIDVRTEVRTIEVRTIEVLGYGMIEVLAHGARMTYGRLPMGERATRASSEHRTSSE